MNTKKPIMKSFFRPRRKVKPLKYLLGKKMPIIRENNESETEINEMNFLGWKEERPDADGLYDGMVLPHTHYQFLYKTS